MTLRIVETLQHPKFSREVNTLAFLHFDKCVGGMNLSQIDKMYVSALLGDKGGLVGIFASTNMSDHASVVLVLSKGTWQIPQSLGI